MTVYSASIPLLCSKWLLRAGKSQTRLDLLFVSQSSLRKSHWNNVREHVRRFHNTFGVKKDIFGPSSLKKPFYFTVAVSGFSFAGAAIWQYENVRRQTFNKNWFGQQIPKYGVLRQRFYKWWNSISEADKVFAPIFFLNLIVFLAWHIPAFHPVMTRYFLSGLKSENVCWPMLLSVFSHYNFFHFGANMYCLHSFTGPAVYALGKEQFLGVYTSAAVISSFTSLLYKTLIRSSTMSLGASGAVMCVLGLVCSKFPDQKVSILFLPQFAIDASTGLKSIMLIDFIGCLQKWSFLDHAGHLGGSIFGVVWHYFGQDLIWEKRKLLIKVWHNFRGPVK